MDESQTYSPFRSVLLREWWRMTSRRLYFGVCIVLPLFTLFFMATIFGNGQMENIPIGIVDQDNTATSRTILCIFPLLALSLLPHLKRAIESHKYENIK